MNLTPYLQFLMMVTFFGRSCGLRRVKAVPYSQSGEQLDTEAGEVCWMRMRRRMMMKR